MVMPLIIINRVSKQLVIYIELNICSCSLWPNLNSSYINIIYKFDQDSIKKLLCPGKDEVWIFNHSLQVTRRTNV